MHTNNQLHCLLLVLAANICSLYGGQKTEPARTETRYKFGPTPLAARDLPGRLVTKKPSRAHDPKPLQAYLKSLDNSLHKQPPAQ